MGGMNEATTFLEQIRRLKGRYVRDQFKLVEKTLKESTEGAWQLCFTVLPITAARAFMYPLY